MRYDVYVGNIGCVSSGIRDLTRTAANKLYSEYVQQSKTGYGRAAGESVTLTCEGEPVKEYVGKNDRQQEGM